MKAHLELVGDHGPGAPVFPADKSVDGMRPFHVEAFGRQWRKALAKVDGLPDGLVFHDLRHTGNTLAAGTGASTRELMARMGHASPRAASTSTPRPNATRRSPKPSQPRSGGAGRSKRRRHKATFQRGGSTRLRSR
jgi:integrase